MCCFSQLFACALDKSAKAFLFFLSVKHKPLLKDNNLAMIYTTC